MAKDWFVSLKELLLSSQSQWTGSSREESEVELERRADYDAGQLALQERRFDDAIPLLKRAIDSMKYRKDALYSLGQCYEQTRMFPLARKAYERLLRLDYNFRDVKERITALDSGKSKPFAAPGNPADHVTVVNIAEDRYEMLATIHDTAVARIYQVRDRVLGRIIAMKQVNPRLEDHKAYLQQLKDRAQSDHPNIARIYDIDERQGQVTMEFVDGTDLWRAMQAKGAFALKSAMFVAVQLINGLHYAHQRQIIHHALIPEHILLTKQGQVKLLGFRALDSFVRLQKTDPPHKLMHVPPELLLQGHVSVTANVYSFGVILYEMITGKPPFSLQQLQAFFRQHAPLQFDAGILPPGLAPILSRCLAVEPDSRFPNLRVVGETLLAWFQGHDAHGEHAGELASYKDFLLMAWADGTITPQEAAFLAQKREELHITDAEARAAETEARQELKALLSGKR
ncbi:hypothetical protein U14_03293 [Candidatus Moduliflexus flocculans]|uniref:Protein kinase domain-containing protein n=1 Tax=Candidatus Moduliflexus flocculans TaxID=1499966 RepID=A0A081BNT0_9BACT|nr:hypothetical protein U14_03293 [Candidatus Moduliflexus flocculans]